MSDPCNVSDGNFFEKSSCLWELQLDCIEGFNPGRISKEFDVEFLKNVIFLKIRNVTLSFYGKKEK